MEQIPWFKELLGYLIPITIFKEDSARHDGLKILRYQGQWLLESKKALYSEGNSYKPFKLAFASIANEIPNLNNFLLLGAGLSSAIKILQENYKHFPSCDVVDYDELIIELNKRLNTLKSFENISYHHNTAEGYLEQNTKKYDLIGVDLFFHMDMAPLVLSNVFLKDIGVILNTKGCLIINTIFAKKKDALAYEKQLNYLYQATRIDYAPNYIFICKKIT